MTLDADHDQLPDPWAVEVRPDEFRPTVAGYQHAALVLDRLTRGEAVELDDRERMLFVFVRNLCGQAAISLTEAGDGSP